MIFVFAELLLWFLLVNTAGPDVCQRCLLSDRRSHPLIGAVQTKTATTPKPLRTTSRKKIPSGTSMDAFEDKFESLF